VAAHPGWARPSPVNRPKADRNLHNGVKVPKEHRPCQKFRAAQNRSGSARAAASATL